MPRPATVFNGCRILRNQLGISQSEMAEHLQVSRNTVVKLENGKMKLPRPLALRYQAVTDCELREGDPDNDKEGPLEIVTTPYEKEDIEKHRNVFEFAAKLHEEKVKPAALKKEVSDLLGKLIDETGKLNDAAERQKALIKLKRDIQVLVMETAYDNDLQELHPPIQKEGDSA